MFVSVSTPTPVLSLFRNKKPTGLNFEAFWRTNSENLVSHPFSFETPSYEALVYFKEFLNFYSLNSSGTILNMRQPRQWGAATIYPESTILWTSGGPPYGDPWGPAGTSEVVNIEAGFSFDHVPLPVQIWNHCLVAFNNKIVYMIGGSRDENSITDDVYYFDIPAYTWFKGPKLNVARRNHTCAVFKDSTTNDVVMAVVGGVDSNNKILDSVEIFRDGGDAFTQGNALHTDTNSIFCSKPRKYSIWAQTLKLHFGNFDFEKI